MESHTDSQPLAGLRVLDLTRVLSGPYATLLLQDMGADIIKIEDPTTGDDTRAWGPPFLDELSGTSTYFGCLNRGKRSVAIDLRKEAGQGAVQRLARECDVVIENFRPSTAAKLGVDSETLRGVNPGLVTCSISGFGTGGDYADLPGTEIVVEAMSGLMSVTGPSDGQPVRFGIAMVDIATGLTAVTRILAALNHARDTGTGTHIEVSLYGTALGVLSTLITSYTATGRTPERWGAQHPSVCPYGGFETSDGYLITGVINDRSWLQFCDALGLDGLRVREDLRTNAGRVAAREEIETAISESCRLKPTEHWVHLLRDRGLLAAPVRTVGQAVDDPATRAMNLFVELEAAGTVYSPRLDGRPATGSSGAVPRLGEHTAEVLTHLASMAPSELNALAAAGAIPHSGSSSANDSTKPESTDAR